MFREGYRAYLLPHVQAIHSGGSSVKQLDLLTYNQEFVYGLRTFCGTFRGPLYNWAVVLILSLNVPVEFGKAVRDVLRRRRSLSSLFAPIIDFWKALAYRPNNARAHLFKLSERPEDQGT
jgi:hypothetical protein